MLAKFARETTKGDVEKCGHYLNLNLIIKS